MFDVLYWHYNIFISWPMYNTVLLFLILSFKGHSNKNRLVIIVLMKLSYLYVSNRSQLWKLYNRTEAIISPKFRTILISHQFIVTKIMHNFVLKHYSKYGPRCYKDYFNESNIYFKLNVHSPDNLSNQWKFDCFDENSFLLDLGDIQSTQHVVISFLT